MQLELFNERIKVLEPIKKYAHVREAGVAVELESLAGKVEFGFENFLITITAYFPA